MKKKMSKEEAVKFVQKVKTKFKHENPNVVDEFIRRKLKENGFKYNKPKNKTSTPKQENKKIAIKNKKDIVNFLKECGIRSERVLESLMEKYELETEGNIELMFEMAKKTVKGPDQQQTFNDANDLQSYYQQQFQQMNPMMNHNVHVDEHSKSNLLEQIQKAKENLNKNLITPSE